MVYRVVLFVLYSRRRLQVEPNTLEFLDREFGNNRPGCRCLLDREMALDQNIYSIGHLVQPLRLFRHTGSECHDRFCHLRNRQNIYLWLVTDVSQIYLLTQQSVSFLPPLVFNSNGLSAAQKTRDVYDVPGFFRS